MIEKRSERRLLSKQAKRALKNRRRQFAALNPQMMQDWKREVAESAYTWVLWLRKKTPIRWAWLAHLGVKTQWNALPGKRFEMVISKWGHEVFRKTYGGAYAVQ